jgi:hypothetical protein
MRIVGALASTWSVLAASPAHAYDLNDWLNVSGFGTIGVAKTSALSGLEYAGGVNVPGGAKDSWSSRLDTKLGVQAVASISPDLTGTIQVLGKYRYDGTYAPSTEWANLKYAFTPDASVRIGRFGAPAFMISDSLNVGYAQPWLRPPLDAYRSMPITHIDGIEGTFRFHWGDAAVTVQPGVGKTKAYLVSTGSVFDLDITNMTSLNLSLENGPYTLRYGKVHGKVKTSTANIGGFTDDFNGLGLIYDKDNWLVQTEYVWRKNGKNVSTIAPANPANIVSVMTAAGMNRLLSTPTPFNSNATYVTAGYRFGSAMPYASVSNYRTQGTFPINKSSAEDTLSLGVRWDFYKNMAFKAQYDRVRTRDGIGLFYRTASDGGLANTPATLASPVNVLSFSIDFVF